MTQLPSYVVPFQYIIKTSISHFKTWSLVSDREVTLRRCDMALCDMALCDMALLYLEFQVADLSALSMVSVCRSCLCYKPRSHHLFCCITSCFMV